MKISRLDTQIIVVADLAKAERFYHETFDLQAIDPVGPAGTITLRAGHQLLVLATQEAAATLGRPGAIPGQDFIALVTKDDQEAVLNHLKSYYVDLVHPWEEGRGAEGKCAVLELHDPDNNTVRLISYKG